MAAVRPKCVRCGDPLEPDADCCASCGTLAVGSDLLPAHLGVTGFLDTVHLPPVPGEPDDNLVVRPSLAILYRMAVGPGADYYGPRFLEFERTGRSFPSWNWASLWAPGVWAFYRRLWVPGLACALWPLAAVAVFLAIAPSLGNSDAAWLACAAILIWLAPGILTALTANALVYRRARRLVREAEATTDRPVDAARLLADANPISAASAISLGGGAMLLAIYLAAPSLETAYGEHVVRARVAEGLAAIKPLQRQVEEGWFLSRSLPAVPDYALVGLQRGAEFLEAVNLNPASGRVRLALGPSVPELWGRAILLAPTLDRWQQVRWVCVPVDIPARYLPQECRQG